MNKRPFLMLLIVFVGMCNLHTVAQESAPTINQFVIDRAAISVSDAEKGETLANFSWSTSGMTEAYHLMLYYRAGDEWVLYDDEFSTPMLLEGQLTLPILHSLTFDPPSARLAILDQAGAVVAESIVSVPYETATSNPEIARFFVGEASGSEIASGHAVVMVSWNIADRTPLSNIRFVQLMEDGSETALSDYEGAFTDPAVWIPSVSSAALRPVAPQVEGNPIRIQMQVYNPKNGEVYASAEATRDGIVDFEIRKFTVTPTEVNRGGTVTLEWESASEEIEGVYLTFFHDLQLWLSGEAIPNPNSSGLFPFSDSVTFTVPDLPITTIRFALAGHSEQAVTLTVHCPYTFFVEGDSPNPCPSTAARDVEAVYQPFEQGFIIKQADEQIWIFRILEDGTLTGLMTPPQPDKAISITPPDGLFAPLADFSYTWDSWENSAFDYLKIGWATGPEQSFTMRIQDTIYGAGKEIGSEWIYFTLPDGRVVSTSYSIRSLSFRGSILP